MPNPLRKYVEKLSDADCKAIHRDSFEWEQRGTTGDSILRMRTEKFLESLGLDADAVSTAAWMDQLCAEVWRRYALSYSRIDQ